MPALNYPSQTGIKPIYLIPYDEIHNIPAEETANVFYVAHLDNDGVFQLESDVPYYLVKLESESGLRFLEPFNNPLEGRARLVHLLAGDNIPPNHVDDDLSKIIAENTLLYLLGITLLALMLVALSLAFPPLGMAIAAMTIFYMAFSVAGGVILMLENALNQKNNKPTNAKSIQPTVVDPKEIRPSHQTYNANAQVRAPSDNSPPGLYTVNDTPTKKRPKNN